MEFEEVARALGLGLSQMTLYGPDHAVTRDALTQTYSRLDAATASLGEVVLSWPEQDLILNGKIVPQRNALVQGLVSRLRELDISALSFQPGITAGELEKVLQIIGRNVDATESYSSLEQAFQSHGISHVVIREIRYEAVEAGQVVTDADRAGDAGDHQAEHDIAVAWLNDEPGQDDSVAAMAMSAAMSDPGRMSDIIVDSARSGEDPQSVESVAARILSNIRRAYDALRTGDFYQGSKGRKELARNLDALGAELVNRTGDDVPAECGPDIANLIGGMMDSLMVESMAADVARQRRVLGENEKRIVRFLKSKEESEVDLEMLSSQMEEAGLSAMDLKRFLREGGMSGGGGGSGTAQGGLSDAVSSMQGLAAGGASGIDENRMMKILGEVESQIGLFMAATEDKVRGLEEKIKTMREDGEGKAGANSAEEQKEMMRILAEITQEICQPLSVVNCSIDMVREQKLGDLQKSQIDMLDLAATSGQRLSTLVDRLSEITGMPTTLSPESDIIDNLYQ